VNESSEQMKKWMLVLVISFMSSVFQTAQAHEKHVQSSDLAMSVAFDPAGNLWRVQVQNGFVQVTKSLDLKTFGTAIKVNPEAQDIRPMGEVRPKIAIGHNGEIYVAWMQNLKARFAGYIWFSRSVDGGKTFEKPYIVHQDRAEIGHAFEALQVTTKGDVVLVWLDSRDLVAAKKAGKTHTGSSIYYAVSSNQGQAFNPEHKLADSSCECCRIVTTNKPDGNVVVLWRHVFAGSERDHMIAEIPVTSAKPPILTRASYGRWQVDGCPHHGAAIATGGEGKDWWGYHMAYFDGNDKKPGLYYSRVDGEAWAISPPKKFGNHAKQAAHPALMSLGEKLWLVWREMDAVQSQIMGMTSDDGGRSWSDVKVLMRAAGNTDYPQLLAFKAHGYLVWNTPSEGLNIIALQ
jgi:hypothetical protein